MNKVFAIFLSFILTFPLTALAQETVGQDAAYRTGKLGNGLTYYIRHHAKEPGLADFYIAQRVGSILEESRQRGLAHFLEHMAFNGTKHFTGKGRSPGIVPWCETIGVKFGANLNAYTSVDQTVYNISSVPVKRQGVIDSCMLILHDWSNSLLLEGKEIDKERGVIQEEWRSRSSARAVQRMMERVLPTVYRGTKYEDCLPIGSMDIVRSFPHDALRDYYYKWYRPDLQAIIVVGDIDVDAVERHIKRLFGSISKPKHAAERIYYPVGDNEKMIVAVDKDSEQPIMLAHLYMKREVTPDLEKNKVQYQKDGYVERLILEMLNGRFAELQHMVVPPCLSASAHSGQFLVSRTKDAFSLTFGCRQENVRGSFDAVIAVAEQARRYGFTEAELQRAKAVQAKSAERMFAERNDRRNSYFAGKAVRHFLASEPLLTAEESLQLVRRFEREVTLNDVNASVKELISDRNQVLVVYAPDKPGFVLPDNDEFERWVLEAQAREYEPYQEENIAEDLMTELPQPGSIVAERDYKYGTRELTLSNGVKVYVKPTDFSKDQVMMSFFGEGGTSLYPDDDVPNFAFLSGGVKKAGVGRFGELALNKMLASKAVSITPYVGNETQGMNGKSSPRDLETMLQLTYLYFTQPRRDEQAFAGEINRMRSFLTNRNASPQVDYNDSTVSILYGNHPRMQPMKREMLDKVNYDRVLQIYRERFSDASGFKMVLVGNVDLDTLRPLLCRYVASLPSFNKSETFAQTQPQVRDVNETHVFRKKTNTPSALVIIYYTFDEPFTPKTDLALDLLKRVLSVAYTDSVREAKGGTYGVSVSYALERTSKPNAMLKISFRTDTAKYDELIPVIYRQIEHVAKEGPPSASMEKAKKFLLKTHGQNVLDNAYWMHVIYQDIRHGIDYDTGFERMLDGVTADDVRRVAQDMLRQNRRIEVTMISE